MQRNAYVCFCVGLHGGVVVSTVTSQQEGSRFNSQLGPFCVEFAHSPSVCVGSLQVLQLPHTIPKHACYINWCPFCESLCDCCLRKVLYKYILLTYLIDPRSECEHGWLFVSLCSCDGRATYPGYILPVVQWHLGWQIGSSPPATLNWIKRL